MSIYERCKEQMNSHLIRKDVVSVPMCITENDRFTFPPKVINLESYELQNDLRWECKHVYYITDIHLVHKINNKFKNTSSDKEIEKYIKQIAKDLITHEIRSCIHEGIIVLFGGDISSDFKVSKIFYTEFMRQCKKEKYSDKCYVYAILGNHEFWSFKNINDCYDAYKNLFGSLGIIFLNNNMFWFGKNEPQILEIQNKSVQIPQGEEELEYSEYVYWYRKDIMRKLLIVGGVGFAGYNQEFNADYGIYRGALSREDEIQETYKWEKLYNDALQYAKETNCAIIVLTHNPICDWKNNKSEDENCIYFSGHTHQNHLLHDWERNIHVFADNQVGYYYSKVQFKEAYIYKRINPFATYGDGCYQIDSNSYLRFYDFMREKIMGNGTVEKMVKASNASFFMIKNKGYYGFFVISYKGIYICAGGNVKRIGECTDMSRIQENFNNMVEGYLRVLEPYRNAQEWISKEVKSFGGEGTIHGSIIDIDFYNHILLSGDGTVIYYYSPVYGEVEQYDSLLSLLDKHNISLATRYRKQLGIKNNRQTENLELQVKEMIKIDIKNSPYVISRKVKQLQRLFDKKILRAWDEKVLLKDRGIKELE